MKAEYRDELMQQLLRSRARLLEVYTSGRLRTKLSIDHDPRTDLSLHVSNFRRPHVVAPWSAAGVAAAQNALASSASAGPSRPNGAGSDSASHILFDDDDDAEVVLQRATRHGHAGGSTGLAAVMMDDHDMSRGRGEYSSDDDDDEDESRARAVPAAKTKAKAKAKAKAEAVVKAKVQAKAKAGVQEISDSDSDSSAGSSDIGSSDSDSDVQWISGGGNSSGAQSALQARRSKSRSKTADDGKRKAGSQSKSKSKSKSSEQRMAERFESVSHDEDDYEVHAERLLREKEEQEAGGGGSGSGNANMDMDEQDELDSSDEDAGVRKEDADADEADEADSRYSTSNRQASKRRKVDQHAEPAGRLGNEKVSSVSESGSEIAFIGTADVAGPSGSNSAAAPASDSARLQIPASSTPRSNDNAGQDASAGLSIKGRARSVASADPTDSRVTQSGTSDPASASGSGVVADERQGGAPTTAQVTDVAASIAPTPAPQAPDLPGQADTAASVPAEKSKSQASRQARRDYWAGKASKPGDGDQDKDEFAEGESYISLAGDV